MPGSAQRSKATAAAIPRFSPLVDNISRGISTLSLSGPQARERRDLWFIPANLALPPPSQLGPSHAKHKPLDHVPRPRNAYILFRSHLIHQAVLPKGIAFLADSQQVSRIASQIWRELTNEEIELFYVLGDEEKRLHQGKYPLYKIKARNGSTKGRARDRPIDESNMTPEQFTCKRIAEMVLQNIRGEELATQIQAVVEATPYSGLFNPASISALSRKKSTDDGDMDFDRITPTSRAKPARKNNKGRANKPQSPSKIRSSSSKKKQSKAATKKPRALAVNLSRRESFFSDNGWSGDLTIDHNSSYTSSEAGLPPASVTSGGVSTENSVDAILYTPPRDFSPFSVENAAGGLLSWDADVSALETPFDQDASFEAYKDSWDSTGERATWDTVSKEYLNGWHDNHTMDQAAYHGAQHGRNYEATHDQVPIDDALFAVDLVASPEPQTISPQCLL